MNYNEDCFYLRKKLVKKPRPGTYTKEVEYRYICTHKKDYMTDRGCPSQNDCKGYKSSRFRNIIGDDL